MQIKNKSDKSADLYIYSEISASDLWGDAVSSKGLKSEIESLGDIDVLNIYINSPGGDVFEGIAIANFLARQKFKKNVYIDGIAASIASVIAFGCGGSVHMYDSSVVMIHRAWGYCSGNAIEMEAYAGKLRQCDESIMAFYKSKVNGKISDEDLQNYVDSESWFDAKTCLELGFADDIITNEGGRIAASLPDKYFSEYKNIPDNIKATSAEPQPAMASGHTEVTGKIPESVETLIRNARLAIKLY